MADGRAGNGENNRAKTHCPQGHPLAGDNLLPADLKRGRRGCRTCHNSKIREYYRRDKEQQMKATPLYKGTDVQRASFQVAGRSYLYRNINEAGTVEYRCENYQGRVVVSEINPTTSFDSFVEQQVKIALDEVNR